MDGYDGWMDGVDVMQHASPRVPRPGACSPQAPSLDFRVPPESQNSCTAVQITGCLSWRYRPRGGGQFTGPENAWPWQFHYGCTFSHSGLGMTPKKYISNQGRENENERKKSNSLHIM